MASFLLFSLASSSFKTGGYITNTKWFKSKLKDELCGAKEYAKLAIETKKKQ